MTYAARRLVILAAATIALVAALLVLAAAQAPRAEACVLTPLSPCGIVGSKVWPIYYEIEDDLPPVPARAAE